MADDISTAFEAPIARAVATGNAEMLDRIAVRDFVQDVEIGAFQSERGTTQRIRFNVVLEVSHSTAARDDDVDKVLSYDTIVEAIEEQLSTERINLLETLAERVAERCLADRRAVRVFVRIEKLDRIPGTLGVEIARARVDLTQKTISALEDPPEPAQNAPAQLVVFLPNTVLEGPHLADWLDAMAGLSCPVVIALEMMSRSLPDTHPLVARRLRLLSVEQNAWILAGQDERCVVVETRTELDHAARIGEMSVWAPSKIVLDSLSKPDEDADQPAYLAHWFSGEINALGLVVVGAAFEGAPELPKVVTLSPGEFAALTELQM